MTVLFWALAAALVALALLLLLWPLLRRRVAGSASRRELNTAVYRDQIADIGRDRASGALAETDFNQAHEELQRRLLEDVVAADPPAPSHHPRAVRTALLLLIAVPMLATLLYGWLGNPAGLLPQTQTRPTAHDADRGGESGGGGDMMTAGGGAPAGGNAGGAGDLAKLADGLAAKLEKKPDPQGFAMLGRTYKAIGRYDDAEKAFNRAGSIMDTDPTLILEQAELGAIRNGGRLDGKPMAAIQKVLKMQPNNPQALLLAGSAAYFRRDFSNAVGYWERLLQQIKPGSEDYQALTSSIAKARSQISGGGGSSMAAALGPVLADSNIPGGGGQSAPVAAAVGGGASVSGRLELAAGFKDKAAPGDTVFIFARAAQGPRMPLAIKRAHVSDLPMDFTLDDSMAMSPELKLSNFGDINVGARISKTGNAMPQSGDLRGTAGPVKPGAKGIKLTIDDVVP
jgi:cytochrome c-type biogenesis protein CcmH